MSEKPHTRLRIDNPRFRLRLDLTPLIKAAANEVLPPTNETQGSDPSNGSQQKQAIEFAGSFLVAIEHRRIVIKAIN